MKYNSETVTWQLSNSTTVAAYSTSAPTPPVGTHDVTFHLNGHGSIGGDTDTHTVTVNDGESVDEPVLPTVPGWALVNWCTDNGTFNNSYSFSTAVTVDLDLYANWVPGSYEVTLTAGTGGEVSADNGSTWGASKVNGAVSSAVNNTPIKARPSSGYVFTGWSTSDGNVSFASQYSANTTISSVLRDLTITANFKPEYAVPGMAVYLYDYATTKLDNVYVSFSDDIEGTHTSTPVKLSSISLPNTTDVVYFAEVPDGGAVRYNFVQFANAATEPTKLSGWKLIENAQSNVCEYNGTYFADLSYPNYLYQDGNSNYQGAGNIYFDNTVTDWDLDVNDDGIDDRYIMFVIGRNGGDKYSAYYQMSKVENTNGKLFYTALPTWNQYSYFGFILVDSTTPWNIGYPNNIGAAEVIADDNVKAYTTFMSYYNLQKYNDSGTFKGKAFIGFGLANGTDAVNSKPVSSLDFLWIRDTDISGNGEYNTDESVTGNAANEGKYLNRAVKVTVNGTDGDVTVNGFKATSAGTSGAGAIDAVTVDAGEEEILYFVRNSTVTLSGITAPTGYTVAMTVDGSPVTPVAGSYTFMVPGGSDKIATTTPNLIVDPIEIEITYTGIIQTVTAISNYYDNVGGVAAGHYTTSGAGGTLSIVDATNSDAAVTTVTGAVFGNTLTLNAAADTGYSVEGIYYSTDNSTWTLIPATSTTNGTGDYATRVTNMTASFTVNVVGPFYFKAEYIGYHVLRVDGEDSFDSMFYSMNNMQRTSYGFKVGERITLSFDNVAKATGIDGMTSSPSVSPTINGHKVSFNMPNSDMTVNGISTMSYDAMVTVKKSDSLDISGLSETAGYFVGNNVGVITIKGSNDYASAFQLNGMTVKLGTLDSVTYQIGNLSGSLTYSGYTLNFEYDSTNHKFTITGSIGGNLTLTPELGTKYNVKIFDTVMSDTFGKTSRIHDNIFGETERFIGNVVVFADESGEGNYDKNGNKIPDENADFSGEEPDWKDEESYDYDYDFIREYAAGTKLKLQFSFKTYEEGFQPANYYQFVGWYTGTSAGPTAVIDDGDDTQVLTEIEYTVTESCFIYAVVTRDLFIGGDYGLTGEHDSRGEEYGNWQNNHNRMDYDVEHGLYYFETHLTADDETGRTGDAGKLYFRLFDSENGQYDYTIYSASKVNLGEPTNRIGDSSFGINLDAENNLPLSGSNSIVIQFTTGHYADGYRLRGETEETLDDYCLTIYYDPKVQLIYAVSDRVQKSIYLSAGNCADLDNLFDKNAGSSNYLPNIRVDFVDLNDIDFINTPEHDNPGDPEEVTGYTANVNEDTAGAESYKMVNMIAPSSTFQVKATIGYNESNLSNLYYKIASFVVYNLDDKNARAEAVTARSDDGIVFTSDDIAASSNLLIVPVVELTDDGITAAGVKEYTVKVDASNVKAEDWGGMFAMYIAGSPSTLAPWPGQAMIPDGNVYSAKVYTHEDITLNSLLFDNYRSNNILNKFARLYEYPTASQTYDYYEPIALIKSGEDNTLIFKITANNDGYHGSYENSDATRKRGVYYLYPNGSYKAKDIEGLADSPASVKGTVYDYIYDIDSHEALNESYKFTYLHDGSGNRMSLNGEAVPSAEVGYYVVCVGDYKYGATVPETPSDGSVDNVYTVNGYTYDGTYAVEWFIYDAEFRFLGHYLSAGLYDKEGASANSYIVDSIYNDSELRAAFAANGESAEFPSMDDLKSKSVMISYEAANTRYNTTRYSGQWVKIDNNKDVHVQVSIAVRDVAGGYYAADSVTNVISTICSACYIGTAEADVSSAAVDLKMNPGTIYLDAGAAADSDVEFVGWYTKSGDRWSQRLSTDTGSFSIKDDGSLEITVYAVYEVKGYYNFTYPDRVGSEKTFTVTRYLNMDEINGYTGNGNHPLVPTYDWTSEAKEYYPTANPLVDITTAAENLVSLITAYRITLTWNVTGAAVSTIGATANSTTKSVTICPAQTTATYTVNYKFADNDTVENAATSVPYGTVITFNSIHAYDEGFTYITHDFNCDSIKYWSASATNGEKILTTQKYFNMILSGSFADSNGVITLYAHTDEPGVVAGTWYPLLEDATNSRRITETNVDKLVIDYMANYFNYEGAIVQQMVGAGNVHYGIVVMHTINATKVDTAEEVDTIARKVINSPKTAGWADSDKDTACYQYDYSDAAHISNFNRTLYTISSNYESVQGKKIVAVAYIKIGDILYTSVLDAGLNIDVPAAVAE